MDVLDWFHLLTPLSVMIALANFIVGRALLPEHRSARLKRFSLIGYSGTLIGWLVMKLGTSFTTITLMTDISIIGWLVLMPSLLLIMSCFIARLAQPRIKFTAVSRKAIYLIFSALKFYFIKIKIFLINLFALTKRPLQQSSAFNESTVSESSFDETVGGQHVFTKDPEGVCGEEYSHPSQDPFSNNWSSR